MDVLVVPSCSRLVKFPGFFHGRGRISLATMKLDATNLCLHQSLVLVTGKREVKLASVNRYHCSCLPGGIVVGFGVVAVVCLVELSLALGL